MALTDRLPTLPFRLPRARGLISVERDIPVPMADGVTLLVDRYTPAGGERAPAVLVRTPYGRRGVAGLINGIPFAYCGYQVVVQSARGTFGSGGEFDPLAEYDDGLATVDWLKRQPWFSGSFATYGASYLGYSAWAMAAAAGPELKAMATSVSASQFREAAYIGGAFALESTLSWIDITARSEQPFGLLSAGLMSRRRAGRAARSGRPLAELDALTTGTEVPFFQNLLTSHEPDASFWDKRDFSHTVRDVTAPASMVGGWYDTFLPWQLKDYEALRKAGRRPYLTIGPWWHSDARHVMVSIRESIGFFQAHLRGDFSRIRANPVRVFVTGAGEWREYQDWPVPAMRPQRWFLQPGHGLGESGPVESTPDTYRYDPANATPSLSGPTLMGSAKPADHRSLERRPDVLVYSSPVLRSDLEIIGPVTADLFVRSDREHTDFVVRLCDVSPDGASHNVCEGGLRLRPAEPAADRDGVRRIHVDLWPAGHRFKRGHRVRVHVASGAYPKVASNPGTGEPLGTAAVMVTADQEVFHDPDRPSSITLPVVPA
ncbi:CocE/NonD family hydrolase [Actinomadura alba]|uniref:CocE/NonD family hydrolase n=1 Tax=Actinomadura alba TaxID=406431 RepID=A0ABR7LPR0_9ACTN|nr:CocE/NonD family hydrolase [Actinomadura alba]MBC6466837.1 CocE/NonD family hydrolase [Actinomadura alba]